MDKMQEDFEAWHKSVVAGDPPHEKYNSGDYRCQHVQRYWFGWKASRETLVIELPKGDSLARRMYGPQASGANPLISRFDAIEAIEAVGLKVAP